MPAVALLLLALWAPVAFLVGLARRPGEPALSWADGLALSTGLALSLVGWLSLLLASLGLFAGPLLLAALAAVGLGATVWACVPPGRAKRDPAHGTVTPAPEAAAATCEAAAAPQVRRGSGGPALRTHRYVARWVRCYGEMTALGVLLAAAATLYQPPFPYLLGGLDPGVYVNTAAHIVRSGSLLWHDTTMAALPPDVRDVLFREPLRPFSAGSRYIGMYILDRAGGIVVPHGLHLYPAFMAALWWAGGLDLALRAGALAALVGVAALYACARRLGGPLAGLFAAGLLSTAIVQSWFARFPSAEPLAQAQVWSGLLTLLIALRGGGRSLPLIGGMLLGSAHLTKVELVTVPAVLALVFTWCWLRARWTAALGWFLVGYAVLVVHAALHAALVAPWYTLSALGLVRLPVWLVLGAPAGLACVVLALWLGRSALRNVAAWVARRRRAIGCALAVLLTMVAAWAYLIRPLGSEALGAYEAHNRQSLVRLGWYTAPPLVPLAVLGLVLALVSGRAEILVVAALALLEAVLHLSDARITPQHLWAGRRLVTILAPGVALFAALALARLWPLGRQDVASARWLRAGLAIALLAWTGWYDATTAAPFVGHVEYAGARADLAALAALVPPDRVVLYEWSDESWRLALPLEMQFGVHGFLVPPEALKDARLPALLHYLAAPRALARGTPSAPGADVGRAEVYWLSSGGNLDWLPPGFRPLLVATRVLVWPEAQRSADRLPWRIERYVAVVDLYRLVPEAGVQRVRGPVLDVGGADSCCLGEGFGRPEQVAGCAACRWATDRAELAVPAPAGRGQRELVLALTAGPAQQAERWVEVWADGALLGRVPLGRGFRTYYLPLPDGGSSRVAIELRSGAAGEAFAVDWARVDLVRTAGQ